MRAFTSTLISSSNIPISSYGNLIAQILTYISLSTICIILIKNNNEKIFQNSEKILISTWRGIVLSIALFGFTLGIHAIEVLIVSNVDVKIAYAIWDFNKFFLFDSDFLSIGFVANIISAVLLAPFAEEIFFRKLLLESLLQKYNIRKSIIVSSLVFAALHFHYFQFVSAFVFAISLSFLYLRSNSIFTCIATHSIFNLFATICDLYDIRPTINEKNITSLYTWLPFLSMFAFSLIALVLFAVRFQRLYSTNRLSYATQ
jgi:membrane protease YdiL (CAAX protease family)